MKKQSGSKGKPSWSQMTGKQKFNTVAEKATGALGIAGSALAIAKTVAGMINVEYKHWDQIQNTPQNVTTTCSKFVTASENCAQGSAPNQRNGDSIRVKSFQLRVLINNNASSDVANVFRIIGVYQKDVNGNPFASASILETNTNVLSPYEVDTQGYRILFDDTFTLSGGTATSGSPVKITRYYNFKPKKTEKIHTQWFVADTAGTNSNLKQGGIYFYIFTDAVSAGNPTYTWYSRMRYVDN